MVAEPDLKRVLLLSPRAADSTAPDGQRARQMLGHLTEFGWSPALAVVGRASGIQGNVIEIPAANFRLGASSTRARAAINRAVDPLIDQFDLVFFSTTAFGVWSLGPRWRRRGLPYVLDWHDPWFDARPPESIRRSPPGGRVKFGLAQALARWREPTVARRAAAHVAVSEAYLDDVFSRYQLDPETPKLVEPFAINARNVERSPVASTSARREWVSIGRLGEGFRDSLECFFAALSRAMASAGTRSMVSAKFIGTSYGVDQRECVLPLARAAGVETHVVEESARIDPESAAAALSAAERVLVFGSDDDRYVPSRLATALASGRPVFVFAPRASQQPWALELATLGGVTVASTLDEATSQIATALATARPADLDRQSFLETHSARAMTGRVASLFDRACALARSGR